MGAIREAAEGDLEKIKSMTDEYIGTDFYSMAYLRDVLKDPDKYLFVYSEENQEPMAYLYIFVSTLREALDILHIPYELFESREKNLEMKVGVYKTTCTDEKCRGKGILTSFLEYLEIIFKQRSTQMILFTALQIGDGSIPVHKAVSSVGFTPVGKIERPWINVDAYCPYCGQDHCICDAVVYSKEMEA